MKHNKLNQSIKVYKAKYVSICKYKSVYACVHCGVAVTVSKKKKKNTLLKETKWIVLFNVCKETLK